MEKICIVKRRRQDLFARSDGEQPKDPLRREEATLVPLRPAGTSLPGTASIISLELTPDQSKAIQSRAELSPGKACMVTLETAGAEPGCVVFSFRFAPLYGGRMLSPSDVCTMLRISRGSLAKLVRGQKIDSYRIGRLRRFLLEDVLHYLSSSREALHDRLTRSLPAQGPESNKE